MRVYCGYYG
jgi:ABC-type multidrug transport system fused ATPase/permease subunit